MLSCRYTSGVYKHKTILSYRMGQKIIFTLLFISSPNVDGFYIFMFHKVVWRRIVKMWWYIW